MRRRGAWIAIATLLVLALSWLAGPTSLEGFPGRLERMALDARYRLRADFPLADVPVDPRICLVLVDDRTLAELPEPRSMWLPLYGAVFRGILDAGARVVGLDAIVEYPRDPERSPLEGRLFEQFGLADFLAGPYTGRVVLIGYLDHDDVSGRYAFQGPSTPLRIGIGDRVGLANLSVDVDGVERTQQLAALVDPKKLEGGEERWAWPYFSPLVAEVLTGQAFRYERDEAGRLQCWLGDRGVPLVEGLDGMLVNYAGQGHVFPSTSFSEVLEQARRVADARRSEEERKAARRWLRERFEGRAVLIGPFAKREGDVVPTPLNPLGITSERHPPLRGVEVHAHILNTLVTGAFLRRASRPINFLAAWAACLVLAFLAWRLSPLAGAVAALASGTAYGLLAAFLFSRFGFWLDVAVPVLAMIAALPCIYGWRYAFERRDLERVRALFGRSVSPEVMEALVRDPGRAALGATERRRVTVLFADINGFSTTCEQHEPEVVLRMLNRYFEEMTEIIFRHHGTIKQFVGDEIMAIYGAPRPLEGAAAEALATAVQMVSRLEELRRLDPTGNNGFYGVKIGIHTGDVIMGNVGTRQRAEYAAVGDDVNLGARIMAMTRPLGESILISESTYEALADRTGALFTCHGPQDVKGREGRVVVYGVRVADAVPFEGCDSTIAPAREG